MTDEMKLAKLDLDSSWIDLSYGEPYILRQELAKLMPSFTFSTESTSYPLAAGLKELVSLLEDKYQSKVIVTNGAKQGISAVAFAIKKMGLNSITIHKPHWVSTPKLLAAQGLDVRYLKENDTASAAFMLTSPNNPDGKEFSSDVMGLMYEHAKQDGVVFVHDAAYYTPIYVNNQNDMLSKYADAQVFSFSKMYGLSGLRIGYLVVNDDRLYAPACEFVEGSTSGVSVPAQLAALEVEKFFIDNPLLRLQFEDTCRDLMTKSRNHLQNLRPDVLTLMNPDSKGMFAWLKPGPNFNSKASKVHMVDGAIFGEPGMVRMNICLDEKIIKEAVERLNNGRPD